MDWIGDLMQSNLAVGVICLLGYVLIRMIERQADKKANGHFNQQDRTDAADRCQRLEAIEVALGELREDFKSYAGHGYAAMNRIEGVQKTVEEIGKRLYDQGERLATMASSAALSNMQVVTALGSQLEAIKQTLQVLGEIRDQAIKQSAHIESMARKGVRP